MMRNLNRKYLKSTKKLIRLLKEFKMMMIRILKKSSNFLLKDNVHKEGKILEKVKVKIKYHKFKLMDLKDPNLKIEIHFLKIKNKLQNKKLSKKTIQRIKKTGKIKEETNPNLQMIFKSITISIKKIIKNMISVEMIRSVHNLSQNFQKLDQTL